MITSDFCCVLCRTGGHPVPVAHEVKGDTQGTLQAVQCPMCSHVQLYPPEYDLGFYEQDGQVAAVISDYGTPIEKVLEHSWIEARRRVERFATHGIDLTSFGPAPRVLDVGGGYGFFGVEVKRQVPGAEVTVLEPSGMRVQMGQEHLAAHCDPAHVPRFDVGLLDETFVAANLHAFDMVTMWHVLEHLPDPVGLLRLALKVLKPGKGRLCIEVPNLNAELMDLSPAFRNRHFMLEHISYFTPATLEATARRAAGAADIRVHGYQRYGIFNATHWIEFNKPQGANPDMFPGTSRWWLEDTWCQSKEETRTSDALFMVVTT